MDFDGRDFSGTWLCGGSGPDPAARRLDHLDLYRDVNNAGRNSLGAQIGGNDWCGIARWLASRAATINSGKGEVGTIRTVIVGATQVVEIAGGAAPPIPTPMPSLSSPIFYHGTMAVEPVDAAPFQDRPTPCSMTRRRWATPKRKADARESRTQALPGGAGQDGSGGERALVPLQARGILVI